MIATHRSYGKSIRLFFVDGTPSGLTVATIANWTGRVVLGRADRMQELLARREASRAGCYLLQGEEPTHPLGVRAYIGRSEELSSRIRDHLTSKEWWDVVALIMTTDDHFTSAHFMALESRMIQLTSENGRAALDNRVRPSSEAGRLGEADQSDIEAFADQLRLLLPPIGINILNGSAAKLKREEIAPPESQEVFEINHRSGVTARAVMVAGDLVVLQGSLAIADNVYQHNAWAGLRQRLIDDGTLVPHDRQRFLVFARNQAFSSPSAAAGVILNRQARGTTEWKLPAEGRSFGAWREEQARYDAGSPDREFE